MISSSRSNPKNTQSSVTETTNLNLQDTEGVALAQSSGNTITVSDQGAIAAAERIAADSLATAEEGQRGARELIGRLGESAFEFGSDAFSAVDQSSGRVLDAATLSIDRQSDLATDALSFGSGVLERAGEFARGIFQDAFAQSASVLKDGQAQLGNTVTNLNTIAREQSTSEAERVQDLAQKALIVAAVMVGLVVLAGAIKARAS